MQIKVFPRNYPFYDDTFIPVQTSSRARGTMTLGGGVGIFQNSTLPISIFTRHSRATYSLSSNPCTFSGDKRTRVTRINDPTLSLCVAAISLNQVEQLKSLLIDKDTSKILHPVVQIVIYKPIAISEVSLALEKVILSG